MRGAPMGQTGEAEFASVTAQCDEVPLKEIILVQERPGLTGLGVGRW